MTNNTICFNQADLKEYIIFSRTYHFVLIIFNISARKTATSFISLICVITKSKMLSTRENCTFSKI